MERVNIYRLKVSLIGRHKQPIGKLHRIIEISGNACFHALHDLIFHAFDREDTHLYQFFLSHNEVKHEGELFRDCKEIVSMPADDDGFDIGGKDMTEHNSFEFRIDEAKLAEKESIYYWFDFGDDWFHRVRVEKIKETSFDGDLDKEYYGEVIKKVGESPAQYPDFPENHEDSKLGLNNNYYLFSVMVSMSNPETSITWAMLDKLNFADLLLENEIVQPVKDDNEIVTLTKAGQFIASLIEGAMQDMQKQLD